MSREWDRENMRTLACRVRTEEAEAFRKYAAQMKTSAHALLADYVHSVVSTSRTMSASASTMVQKLLADGELKDRRITRLEDEVATLKILTKQLTLRAERAERLVHDYVLDS